MTSGSAPAAGSPVPRPCFAGRVPEIQDPLNHDLYHPRAFRVAKELRCGHVGVNTAQRHHEAPFGGFKMSGVGRDGGDFGLYAYTELQSIIWPS